MPLGWIDFSQKDRNLILSVLESLTEKKAVDELGVASIRDGFANLFFPGTSTLQTRAKYFLRSGMVLAHIYPRILAK